MKQREIKTIKRVKKNAKRLRSVIMLALMSIMLLSTATYAWFTLSDTARISGLTMSVTDVTGLRIHPDVDGNKPSEASDKWSSKIDFAENGAPTLWKGSLLPATTKDGIVFHKPVYDEDGKVSEVEELTGEDGKLSKTSAEDAEGYYYETSFWMESMGEAGEIVLVNGDTSGNKKTGTYVIEDNTDKSGKTTMNAITALRISITDGNETAVYEPYSELHNENGLKTEIETAVKNMLITNTKKQNSNGSFVNGTDGASAKLFTLEADEITKITIRIWIEGNDDDCVNQIQLANLLAQLQFKKLSNTTTP